MDVLLPTLVAACLNNVRNKEILSQEMDCGTVAQYLDSVSQEESGAAGALTGAHVFLTSNSCIKQVCPPSPSATSLVGASQRVLSPVTQSALMEY